MRRTCRHLDLFIHMSYLFLVVLSSIEHCSACKPTRWATHSSSIVFSVCVCGQRYTTDCALNDRHVRQEALRRDNDACFYATMLLLLLLLLCAINPNGRGGEGCVFSLLSIILTCCLTRSVNTRSKEIVLTSWASENLATKRYQKQEENNWEKIFIVAPHDNLLGQRKLI